MALIDAALPMEIGSIRFNELRRDRVDFYAFELRYEACDRRWIGVVGRSFHCAQQGHAIVQIHVLWIEGRCPAAIMLGLAETSPHSHRPVA